MCRHGPDCDLAAEGQARVTPPERKELIAGYVADGRWEAAMRQAREYQALYPEDRAYVESVLRSNPAK